MLYLLCSDLAVVCRSILTRTVRLDKAYSTIDVRDSMTLGPFRTSGCVCYKVKSFID